ncbi:Replicase polyprotein 1a [Trichinella pseudospiralis]
MPGLGLPADSCFDSDAFQFCAVSRLSATPFRSAIIFSRRFHFTLLPLLLNTPRPSVFYYSERQCRIQSCRSTIGHTVAMALSMPARRPACRDRASSAQSSHRLVLVTSLRFVCSSGEICWAVTSTHPNFAPFQHNRRRANTASSSLSNRALLLLLFDFSALFN